jgi:hypothetical protein
MAKLMAGLVVFTSSLLLLALAPSIAVAQIPVTVSAQNNNSHGAWQFANYCLQPGDYLIFSNASGTWRDGNTVSGPNGSTMPWPDNFLNHADLGVGPYQARTPKPYWDALVGYIGTLPPQRGSYTSMTVLSEALRVFPVFPQGGTSSVFKLAESGCLFLAFNADAYSNYTVDNSGSVTVTVAADTNYRPPSPNLGPVCQYLPDPWFQAVCWVGNLFVGGPIAR